MRNKDLNGLFIAAPRLNQFHILNLLASDPHLTQAELALRCDLSVAMVNNYMKELRGAGLLDYRCKSTKSVSYHITPAGHEKAEFVRLQLLKEMVGLFAEAKEQIRRIILARSQEVLKRVVLCGSGDLAEVAFLAIESAGVEVIGICDHAQDRVGRDWLGRKILSLAQILSLQPDTVIIADPERATEMIRDLAPLQEQGVRILELWTTNTTGIPADTESAHQSPYGSADNGQ